MKVKFPTCKQWRHIKGSDIQPHTLTSLTRCWSVASDTLRKSYPRRSKHPLNRRLGGPPEPVWTISERMLRNVSCICSACNDIIIDSFSTCQSLPVLWAIRPRCSILSQLISTFQWTVVLGIFTTYGGRRGFVCHIGPIHPPPPNHKWHSNFFTPSIFPNSSSAAASMTRNVHNLQYKSYLITTSRNFYQPLSQVFL